MEAQFKSVIICPFYAVGHITPCVLLAKRLASRGVKVLFVFPGQALYDRVEKTLDLEGLDISIHVVDFKDDFDKDTNARVIAKGIRNVQIPYHGKLQDILSSRLQLLRRKFEDLHANSRVSAAIVDLMNLWAGILVDKLGFPVYCFNAISVAATLGLLRSYSEEHNSQWGNRVPGLPPLRPYDLSRPQHHQYREVNSDRAKWFLAAEGFIVNSFYDLEPGAFDTLKKISKAVFGVGPMVETTGVFRGAIQDQDEACLSWLDDREPKSVLYICFGSWLELPEQQLQEIALGVEASGQSFLWVMDEKSQELEWMPGFQSRTKEQGIIVFGWAPQQAILGRAAVGAFIVTCGWNSVLESILLGHGIALVAWPLFGDHLITCRYIVDGAMIAAEVNSADEEGLVGRDEVERVVRLVLTGSQGEKMRENVSKLKLAAGRATAPGGTSHTSLESFIAGL